MNELEPDAQQQWLWFGAVLLAMTIIALIATSLPSWRISGLDGF
jgi:ABC-type lipoprotein release transport system permease subunit